MFSSQRRKDAIKQAEDFAADQKRRADAYRQETADGVRSAGDCRTSDPAFARGWKAQREPNQAIFDANARFAAASVKKRRR